MFIYGLNGLGDHVHIADAPKGNAAQLTCLYCQGKLTAKKGDILTHHFAHQKDQGDTCRGSSSTFQKIVFGFDYYDFALTSSQKKALYTLTDACLSQPEGYLMERFIWHQPRSAKYLLYQRGIAKNRASDRIVEELLEEGFFTKQQQTLPAEPPAARYTYQQQPIVMDVLRPTPKALAFCLKLPLYQFIRVLLTWWDELATQLTDPLEKDLFERHKQRMAQNRLYFLSIKANWERGQQKQIDGRNSSDETSSAIDVAIRSAERPLFKIGITTRPILERIAEIRQFLRKNGCPDPKIELVHDLDGGAALAELYFKKRYKTDQFPVGNATEYFALDAEQIRGLKPDFHQLILKTKGHATRIKEGMEAMAYKPVRGKEKAASFLAKPQIQALLPLLTQGRSLRDLNRITGIAINTIRKAMGLTSPSDESGDVVGKALD